MSRNWLFPHQPTRETQRPRGILRQLVPSRLWTVSWALQKWTRTPWAPQRLTNSTTSLMCRYWLACRRRVCNCSTYSCFVFCVPTTFLQYNCLVVRFETGLRRNSIQTKLGLFLPLATAQHLQRPGVRYTQSGGRWGGGASGLPPALQPLQPVPPTLSTRLSQELASLTLPCSFYRVQPQPRLASAQHQPPAAASPLAAGSRPADQRGEEWR